MSRKETKSIFKIAKMNGNKIITAAEFLKKENHLLEANRKEIYQQFPPSTNFLQWVQNTSKNKIVDKPPIDCNI